MNPYKSKIEVASLGLFTFWKTEWTRTHCSPREAICIIEVRDD